MNAARTRRLGFWLIGLATAGAASLASPGIASAGHFGVKLAIGRRSVWVPAAYETRPRRVTIPAEYVVREREVWREPVYEIQDRLVEIPAQVVTKRVARYDRRGDFAGYDTVTRIVSPARQIWKKERVLLEPGYYETVPQRVCIRAARTDLIYEKVLVAPGHWAKPRPTIIHQGRPHGRRVVRHGPHHRLTPARGLEVSFELRR